MHLQADHDFPIARGAGNEIGGAFGHKGLCWQGFQLFSRLPAPRHPTGNSWRACRIGWKPDVLQVQNNPAERVAPEMRDRVWEAVHV